MPIIDPTLPPVPANAASLERRTWPAMRRGLHMRCPSCGEGALFRAYLKPTAACDRCGEPFGHIRTDDIAPWLTILVVGHIVVPLVLWSEQVMSPPLWLSMTVWPLVTAIGMALFLPRAKGMALGLMWSKRLTGDERH
jgi:uncharacterized protein (DUF983 family)